MQREEQVVAAIVLGFIFVVAGSIWFVMTDVEKHGHVICGQVSVTTPEGESALVEKCWREKP